MTRACLLAFAAERRKRHRVVVRAGPPTACWIAFVDLRQVGVAVLLAVAIASATHCGKQCLSESKVEDRLNGSVVVATASLAAACPLSIDNIQGTGEHCAGVMCGFRATANAFDLQFANGTLSGGVLVLATIDKSSTNGGSVSLCTCPNDHPVMTPIGPPLAALCLANGPGGVKDGDYVAPNCQPIAGAHITIVNQTDRQCQTPTYSDTACSEQLYVDVSVPAIPGAAFSGDISIRHKVEAVPHSCPDN